MFEMQLQWWEYLARAVIIYAALLVMVRVSGKRTVGQFTPFDLLVVMLLSEGVSNALSGGDASVSGGLLTAAALLGLNSLVGLLSSRSKRIENIVEGHPVLIGRDGYWFDDVVLKHRLGAGDIERALREAGCALHDMEYAVLEADGNISVRKRQSNGAAL